jgi:sec-independent protein translocase protein TatC
VVSSGVSDLIFEVPLVITLLAKLGWVDAPLLKRYRKWAFLAAFIFAAILTPTPDPFNQCLMALPMYIFYEVGIVSAGIFNKKKAAAPGRGACAGGRRRGTRSTGKPGRRMPSGGGESEYVGVPTGRRG